MKCSHVLEDIFHRGLYISMILKFQHKVQVVEVAEGHCSLCAQFEDCAVSHSVYERTEMFRKGQKCLAYAEYMGLSFSVNVQWNTEVQKPQIWKTERAVLL